MTPNEEQLAFYHQIGMAITQWAHVEHALLGVALTCVEKKDDSMFAIAFFSIENFRSKLQVTDNLFSAKFRNTVHFSTWVALHKRAESAAKARNSLAHYSVVVYPNEQPGRWWALLPRLGNMRKPPPKRQQKVPPGSLFVRDISLSSRRFSSLANALWNFAARVEGRAAPLPEYPEQELRPMTIRELRHLIHALSGTPPKPTTA